MTQAGEFLTSFNFYLQIDGVVDKLPIKGFSTGQAEAQVPEQIMGTGPQGRISLQATPTTINSNPVDLTVTTMIMENDSQFFQWFDRCLAVQGGSRQVMTERKTGSVFALKQDGGVAYQCDFSNAFPKNYQPPEFDASSSEMASETWTLVCEGYRRVK